MRYYPTSDGKQIMVIFDRGDLMMEELQRLIDEKGIETAIITAGLGSFDRCNFHWITSTGLPMTDQSLSLEGPVEIASISGNIVDSQPHIHVCVSDLNRVYTGHLEPGSRVCYRAEMCLQVLEGVRLRSQVNAATGLVEIVPKE